ncbi:hypothetical protein KY290_002520 [Solanum tuberosum]|uniref:Adhesive plaque matrix protein-like n=1 Tax=Solanum tuberosum TaxID=4113 RepID=A0ABQ7WQA6_SOLTU|nr:hypothetical protein KY285_002450 [Solanum tuberosum]KAH0782922.1 hypothetical protein KY290_002520 [Solanum tuberosum]
MASFSKGGSFNTYSDYPDHVCRPVIVEHSVGGYMVRAQRVVEVRRSYDIPLNGLVDEYNMHEEWDDDSPRKVNDFFHKVHDEASRPTHSTLLSPPKLITKRPSWTSEDHDSPKYREHHDFSGSPLRNKFEGFHLQNSRGSSPYKYKNDGYAHSMDSPKAGHVKDYGVNNTWDSPPRSRLTHEDWDSRRDHDDYGKPKFNGGYKATSPPLSQATNDIGTAMKILGVGNKPLTSPNYAPKSHFPASYSTPHIKESYPEPTKGMMPLLYPVPQRKESYPEAPHGTKPLFSPIHTQQPYSPTSIPIPQRKENYPETNPGPKPLFSPGYTQQSHSPTSNPTPQRPEAAHGTKPLFSSVHTQQPYSPTSNSIPQRKENYPETTHGPRPLFSPGYTQQSHSPTPQRKESHPEAAHGTKPLFTPIHTQQPYSPTSNPIPQRKENYPEATHGPRPLFSPGYTQQSHSPTSNPIPQRKESYSETAHGTKPLFTPVHTQQPYSPTSNPIPQRKESYPETAHGAKPLFSSGYTPQSHSPTSNPTPQRKESYPETTHDTNPMFSPVSTQQSTANPTSQNNESQPKKKKGWTSLFSSNAKQQPHPPTSHSTPDMKQSYPDHETQGFHPSFSPPSPQKERYSPQMKDHYPDQIQRNESFPSPYENTQEPRYGAIAPPEETLDSSEARRKYANLKPVSPAQMKYSGTIDSKEAVKKYNGAFVP